METIGLHVSSDEQHLTTYDKGVATTFEYLDPMIKN
jgi:hypothetical protein